MAWSIAVLAMLLLASCTQSTWQTHSHVLMVCTSAGVTSIPVPKMSPTRYDQDAFACEPKSPKNARQIQWSDNPPKLQTISAHNKSQQPETIYVFDPMDSNQYRYRWKDNDSFELLILSARESKWVPQELSCKQAKPFTPLHAMCWNYHQDIYYLAEGKHLQKLTALAGPICNLEFVPNQPYASFQLGDICVSGAQPASTYIVNLQSNQLHLIHTGANSELSKTTWVQWSPDGQKASVSQIDFNDPRYGVNVLAWANLDQIVSNIPAIPVKEITSAVHTMSWSSNSSLLAAVSNGFLHIYDTTKATLRSVAIGSEGWFAKECRELWKIKWSPNGQYVALVCGHKSVIVYNLASGSFTTFSDNVFQPVDLQWSPDNHYAAYRSFSGNKSKAFLIDMTSDKQVDLSQAIPEIGAVKALLLSAE